MLGDLRTCCLLFNCSHVTSVIHAIRHQVLAGWWYTSLSTGGIFWPCLYSYSSMLVHFWWWHLTASSKPKTWWQLQCDIYCCKQAARSWFQFINHNQRAEDFCQSTINPCLYMHHYCLMFIYRDDCPIFSSSDATFLSEPISETYLLEDQGNVNNILVICIKQGTISKSISMTQTRLIESIIQNLGFDNIQKYKNYTIWCYSLSWYRKI